MTYIFQKRYNLQEIARQQATKEATVMLGVFPWELGEIYARHLRLQNFIAVASPEAARLEEALVRHEPDLLLLNLTANPLSLLKTVRQARPLLTVVTVGGGEHNLHLPELMALGVSGHVNRHLSRPGDVAIIARQVLFGSGRIH